MKKSLCLVNISLIPGEQYLMTSLEVEFHILIERLNISTSLETIILSSKPTWAY